MKRLFSIFLVAFSLTGYAQTEIHHDIVLKDLPLGRCSASDIKDWLHTAWKVDVKTIEPASANKQTVNITLDWFNENKRDLYRQLIALRCQNSSPQQAFMIIKSRKCKLKAIKETANLLTPVKSAHKIYTGLNIDYYKVQFKQYVDNDKIFDFVERINQLCR